MPVALVVAVFIGGGCGAWVRYVVGARLDRCLGATSPISAVFIINILGSTLLGATLALFRALDLTATGSPVPGAAALAFQGISTGALGGFTTFSTAAVEAVQALRGRNIKRFLTLWLCQPALALACLLLAYLVTGAVLGMPAG